MINRLSFMPNFNLMLQFAMGDQTLKRLSRIASQATVNKFLAMALSEGLIIKKDKKKGHTIFYTATHKGALLAGYLYKIKEKVDEHANEIKKSGK